MNTEQMNVALGLFAMASIGALLVVHTRSTRPVVAASVVPPPDTAPATDPAYDNLPDYLKINAPPIDADHTMFIPNASSPYVPSFTN